MKVKAVEKLLKFDKNSAGVYRYVMSPEMYSSLNQKKVIKEVKRVTSTDDAEVEDPENENGGTTGGGGSQNQGGGENTNPTNPGGNGGDDEEEGGQN